MKRYIKASEEQFVSGFFFEFGNKGIFLCSDKVNLTDNIVKQIIHIICDIKKVSEERRYQYIYDRDTLNDFRRRIEKAELITHKDASHPYYTIKGKNFTLNMPEDEFRSCITVKEDADSRNHSKIRDLYCSTEGKYSSSKLLDDLDWIEGLYWDVDGHSFTVTGVNGWNLSCQITESWISEDTWKDQTNSEWYDIKLSESGEDICFVNREYPKFRFCASAAFNYDSKCPKEFNVYEKYLPSDESDEDEYEEDLDDYTPSASRGDYSPSNPWDAPGMSIHDFI